MPSSKLEKLIRNFVAEVRQVALEDVIDALGSMSPLGSVRAIKPARAAARPFAPGKGNKRSPDALQKLELQLHHYIGKNPGQRIEQIGRGMDVSTKELALPVKKLLAAKKLTTKGQKRATSYFVKG